MTENRHESDEDVYPKPDHPRDQIANREWHVIADALLVISRHKVLVIAFPVAVAVLAGVLSVFIPPTYVASAKLLPPQQSQSTASMMLGQLGALAGMAGGGGIGLKSPSDIYVAVLRSRKIADSLIQRFNLRDVYGSSLMVDTRRALEGETVVASGKDGVISISVGDRDPKRAAAIANAYIEEFYKLMQNFAVTEASQRRLFFERQLVQSKEALADAEVRLKRIQEKTGLIKLEEQGRAIIEAISRAKAQVAAKEVQLTAMRVYLAENNPDYALAQQELQALRAQLAQLEQRENRAKGDVFLPTQRVPEAGLAYVRGFRDVKYHETMFELLAKQFELAKIDEAKDGSLVQVLEDAIEPERRSSPQRRIIVLAAFFAALLIGIIAAFVREAAAKASADPLLSEKLASARSNLSWRGRLRAD